MSLHVINRAMEQLDIVKSDGDTAHFAHLLYMGELISKLSALGLCAAICDDSDRHRYAQLHRLVRADGLGVWAQVIDEVVNGPTANLLNSDMQQERRELNTRSTSEAWQYRAISSLDFCLRRLAPDRQGLPAKLEGRTWFSTFAELRNATRGHGALGPTLSAELAPHLEASIKLLVENFSLFMREWVYLRKNLSGRYRVTRLGQEDKSFQVLKSADPHKWGALADGVYIFCGRPLRVDLLFTDADLTDYFLPNGAFREKGFEVLSYLSNSKHTESNAAYLAPATQLPPSETQGCKDIGTSGESFANLPQLAQGYVRRRDLEGRLLALLSNLERHPIVSLIGRGGIGKTSLALFTLEHVGKLGLFSAVLWFSSRDIDLLPSGPKPVRPHLLDEKEMAKEFAGLLGQLLPESASKALDYFATSLGKSPLDRPILFIFDNFETVSNPIQVYNWLDTYIRSPNKLLITSRFREFKGDYAMDVLGMEENESFELIDRLSKQLGIENLITEQVRGQLYREADGHPYVLKMLLGEIARQGQVTQIERVIASKEEILDALFERSFVKLSPAAQVVFLTLSRWRSVIPRVALEAVMLRPANEKLDVEAALDELEQSSFVEIVKEAGDEQDFVVTPLSAAVFGKRKLESSSMKLAVEANVQLLLFFGPGQRSDLKHGIGPRVERFFRKIALETTSGEKDFEQYLPMLEYISRRYVRGWLLLSQMYEEQSQVSGSVENAKSAVRRFIEASAADITAKRLGWQHLVRLAKASNDIPAEVHGMMELSSLPQASFDSISETANRVNQLNKWQGSQVASDERKLLADKLLAIAEPRLSEAGATDLSRFAWLFLSIGREDRARTLTAQGLLLEGENEYCLRLAERLGLTE